MAATLLTDTELERDRRLVEAHQAGDASAFGQLYQHHYDRLLRFCQRKVRDAHLAEEIAQETFLKAYRALEGLDGGKRFYPWLTVIASRLVIDHHRRSGRVRPSADIDLGSVDDAHEAIERQVDRQHVLMALDRVRVRHREVLHLRDYEDLSYEAIAQRLGTSPAIVQSLLHRARQALRREYLAVTEHAAVAPLLVSFVAALRRLRLRAGRLAAWVPDPSGFGAPLAAAAVAVSTALGGWPAPTAPAPAYQPVSAPAYQHLPVSSAPRDASGTSEQVTVTVPVPAPGRADQQPPPPAEVWLGPDGAAEARAHGQQMPAQIDTGSALVAADPETIVEDTVRAARRLLGGN